MDEDVAKQFRFMCRQNTRARIVELADGELGRTLAQMWPGTGLADGSVLRLAREELAKQAEPDGTRDVIPCPRCGVKNRVPLSGAARCGRCKALLQ